MDHEELTLAHEAVDLTALPPANDFAAWYHLARPFLVGAQALMGFIYPKAGIVIGGLIAAGDTAFGAT